MHKPTVFVCAAVESVRLRLRAELLDDAELRAKFVKVLPNEYVRALSEMHAKAQQGAKMAFTERAFWPLHEPHVLFDNFHFLSVIGS